jgi:hypothetical protein
MSTNEPDLQRAKPGNPGYGFRRARWRDTLENEDDRQCCESALKEVGFEEERIMTILQRVQEVWHGRMLGRGRCGECMPVAHSMVDSSSFY